MKYSNLELRSKLVDSIEDHESLAKHFNLSRERFDYDDKPISTEEYKKIADFFDCIDFLDSTTIDNEVPLIAYIIKRGAVDYAIDNFEDAYCGAWDSKVDYAIDNFEDTYCRAWDSEVDNAADLIEEYAYDLFISDYSYILWDSDFDYATGFVFRNL